MIKRLRQRAGELPVESFNRKYDSAAAAFLVLRRVRPSPPSVHVLMRLPTSDLILLLSSDTVRIARLCVR